MKKKRKYPTSLTLIKYIAKSDGILKDGEGYLTKYQIINLCKRWLKAVTIRDRIKVDN